MSRWAEQFEGHPIHETLKWLHESVSKEFDDIDENEVSEKRRFLKLVDRYKLVLENLDPETVPFNQLDSLNNNLRHQNLANQINAYAQNGTVANLAAASDLLTNQLTVLSILLSLAQKLPAHNQVIELETLIDSATSTLVEKKDSLAKEIEKLDSSVTDKENQLAELTKQIEHKNTELTATVNQWQSQFSSAQESRSQEFSKWRDSFSKEKGAEVDSKIQQFQENLEKSKEEFNNKINNIINDGNEKHKSIINLYQITAGDSVGAGYLKNANDEKKQADNWRRISVTFIVLTGIWLLFSFFYNTTRIHPTPSLISQAKTPINEINNEPLEQQGEKTDPEEQLQSVETEKSEHFPWYTLFVTFSLSGVLLWGSAYAGQQSTKHRNNEKQTRWFALEVRAIDPFLNSLEIKDRNELKKQLSGKIFGQVFNKSSEDVKVIDEHVFKTVADTLGGILSKIPK